MLHRHAPLRPELDRWARAFASSVTPRSRAAARTLQNRWLARTNDQPDAYPPVDVWAQAEALSIEVLATLEAAGVAATRTWLGGHAILIDADAAGAAVAALRADPRSPTWWVRRPGHRYRPLAQARAPRRPGRWRIRAYTGAEPVERLPGPGIGVILQFVGRDSGPAGDRQPLHLIDRPHVLHMVEPIDAVYTWVDDSDPEWRRQRASVAPASGVTIDALSPSRTVDHGELRYSLRSLAVFANWFRHIWVVTSGQVPDWLDIDHPKLTVVPHDQIFTDPTALPTFNSHAIESQLHHIDGLAEHFVYLNDDVFFGRPVAPELFFHGNGVAKFMISDMAIDIDPDDTPRNGASSAARNNRELIEQLWGRSVTNRMKHVPHAHRRSTLHDLEQRSPEVFAQVARSRFRSVDDVSIASDLGHYHAYALGPAVTATIGFRYVDIAAPDAGTYLDDLAGRRAFDVFCINDTVDEASAIRRADVAGFLERYFPAPSPFERIDR